MKIYPKTGDQGLTSLIGGTRVPKSSLRIDCYGTVDELNSYIGLLRDQDVNATRRNLLKEIQDRLFTIGASLASDPEKSKMKIPDLHEADVTLLEEEMDRMNAELKTAFASKEIRDAWTGLGSEIPTLTGSAFGDFVNAETTRWAAVVKAGNIKMD